MVIVALWFFLVLAVFGGAICRIMALRLARDEGISLGGALTFSVGSIKDYMAIPLILGIGILFFWALNLLAGLTSSIPIVGPFLMIILYALSIISSLIILLIAVGAVLGLLMMIAAISTEKNGALDAISRAFSYIYSRPLQFFFYYFLVFLLASIIVLIGGKMLPNIVQDSFAAGTWPDSTFEAAFVDGSEQAQARDFPNFSEHGFFPSIGLFFAWLFMSLLLLGVFGYVITYIMGGTTAIYFALRREVDGTEDSEIYIEGMEDEEDFGLPPVTPPAPVADEPAAEEPAAEEKEKAEEHEEEKPEAEKPEAEAEPEEESAGEDGTEEEEKKE
jgi:hypothetical protein